MALCYQGNEVTAPSRYTHVYTRENGRWGLMSAQGTPTRAPGMSIGRVPLFCDTALAGRIERAEAQLIGQNSEAARRRSGTAGFVIPIAGGVASFPGRVRRSTRSRGSASAPSPAELPALADLFGLREHRPQ